jgi:hypothetical protein
MQGFNGDAGKLSEFVGPIDVAQDCPPSNMLCCDLGSESSAFFSGGMADRDFPEDVQPRRFSERELNSHEPCGPTDFFMPLRQGCLEDVRHVESDVHCTDVNVRHIALNVPDAALSVPHAGLKVRHPGSGMPRAELRNGLQSLQGACPGSGIAQASLGLPHVDFAVAPVGLSAGPFAFDSRHAELQCRT